MAEHADDHDSGEEAAEDAHDRYQPSLVTDRANIHPDDDADDEEARRALVDEVEDDD